MLARSSVSHTSRPPLPSTRARNSLIVHSSGGVQLPNAWSRLSVLARFLVGSLPGRAVHATTNFMSTPLVRPTHARSTKHAGADQACRGSRVRVAAAHGGRWSGGPRGPGGAQ